MPRKAKGPRLVLKRYRNGDRWWIIVDRRSERGTGCREHELAGAERALAAYIAEKYQPKREATSLDNLLVADVVSIYIKEHAPHAANPAFIAATAEPILKWWGTRPLADVRGQTCRDYVTWRTAQTIKHRKRARQVSEATARHDLKTLRAAVNYWHAEYGPLPSLPKVTLPPKPFPRDLSWPVWHLDKPLDYLSELADGWPGVCLGSAGAYAVIGTPAWERRMDQVFEHLARRGRLPWLHGLRMLGQVRSYPLASADSTNVAQNFGRDTGCAYCKARQLNRQNHGRPSKPSGSGDLFDDAA